jgi:hypothetical protein
MGGGGALLAWPTTAASPQITMEIHISNWTHKFQNNTGLDAKANSELYKSNRVCSASEKEKTNFLQQYFQFHKHTLTYQNVLKQTPAFFTINMAVYTLKKILIRECSFFCLGISSHLSCFSILYLTPKSLRLISMCLRRLGLNQGQ